MPSHFRNKAIPNEQLNICHFLGQELKGRCQVRAGLRLLSVKVESHIVITAIHEERNSVSHGHKMAVNAAELVCHCSVLKLDETGHLHSILI